MRCTAKMEKHVNGRGWFHMSGYGMRFVVRLWMAAYAANWIGPCSDSCGKRVQNRMAEVGKSVMTSELGVSFHWDNYAKKQNLPLYNITPGQTVLSSTWSTVGISPRQIVGLWPDYDRPLCSLLKPVLDYIMYPPEVFSSLIVRF